MNRNKQALDEAIRHLGDNAWYVRLHYFRFLTTLSWVTKKSATGSKGLEIGTWPGYLALALRNAGYEETGVDIDPSRIQNIGFNISQINLHTNPLPFPDNSFDFITCTEVIEHIETAILPTIIREVYRVLKPTGHLFITTPNKNRLGQILRRNKTHVDSHGHGHEHEYQKAEVAHIIKNAGFYIERVRTISFYAGIGKTKNDTYFYPLLNFSYYDNKKRNIFKLFLYPFLKYMSPFRDSFYVIAKKPAK